MWGTPPTLGIQLREAEFKPQKSRSSFLAGITYPLLSLSSESWGLIYNKTAIKLTESVQAYMDLTTRQYQTRWGINSTGSQECPGPDQPLAFNMPKFTLFLCFPHTSTTTGF